MMSAHSETELSEQSNKPQIGPILQPQRSGCPIANEISHRIQLPPVVSRYNSVDVGGVCLSRDYFCPESAYCFLCSFVAKLRPISTKGASLKSVHFVLDDSTNTRLRWWTDTQLSNQTPPPNVFLRDDLMIAVTTGANVFERVSWHRTTPTDYGREPGSENGILATFRLWRYQDQNCNFPAPRLDTLTYIAKRAKECLHLCDERHKACQSLVSRSIPPISLIDCNQHCLVHGSQGIRYVALSYVWGKTGRNFNLPEREYGVPLTGLPRTISDAITVTKSLGYDYLWVDMLCIDQKNKEEKHSQIAIMDQIYRSADLTIIVAAGSDCGYGIPGVSERWRPPRRPITILNTKLIEEKEDAVNEIEASVWRSRGWTFQEGLLSRRRLVFTKSQMLFSCFSYQAVEDNEGPEFSHSAKEAMRKMHQVSNLWDTSLLQTNNRPRTTLIRNERPYARYFGNATTLENYGFPIEFAELLEKYSTLEFSFESDIVNGFRAIGNTFALRSPQVLHLYGLPFIVYDASSLTRGLAWCLERGNEENVRRPGFPSWSWLGYRGPVRWGAMLRDGAYGPVDRQWTATTFSHVRSMITISNRKFELLQLRQWWREWSSAKASEALTPSRLIMSGPMVTQKVWSGAERTPQDGPRTNSFALTGKCSDFRYCVGGNLMMSEDACRCLLENLRRGSWRALLLTDEFLLFIQSVAADAKCGPYKRVASAEIKVFHTEKFHRVERDNFVKRCTEPVDVDLV